MKTTLAFIGILLIVTSCIADPYGVETQEAMKNHVYVDASGHSPSLQAVLDKVPSGGVVELGAGTYTVPSATTISTACTIKGAGQELTTLQIVDTLNLGADSIFFRDLKLQSDSLICIIDNGNQMVARNITVQCPAFAFPQDTAFFEGCEFYPQKDSAWVIQGGGTVVNFWNCQFGTDIPMHANQTSNLWIKDGAVASLFNCHFVANDVSTGATKIIVNGTGIPKLFTHNLRMICDKGYAISVADTSFALIQQSYIEGSYASTNPTICVSDTGRLVIDHSWISSTNADTALFFDSKSTLDVQSSHFSGIVDIENAKYAKFFGMSSIETETGGVTLLDPNDKVIGGLTQYIAHLVGQFSGTDAADTLVVPGIVSAQRTQVVFNWINSSTMANDEAKPAIQVKQDTLILHRDATAPTNNASYGVIVTWNE